MDNGSDDATLIGPYPGNPDGSGLHTPASDSTDGRELVIHPVRLGRRGDCGGRVHEHGTLLDGGRGKHSDHVADPHSKIEVITSSMLAWIDESSVTAQLTATWQARRGAIPCDISLPA